MELFAEFWVRCVLDCGYPLSPRAFILGFGLGVVAGRARAPGPTRRAKWAKKWFALGSWRAAISRQDEPIERRPEEQGTQNAHKKQLRRCDYPLQWPLKPSPL
jgi:hypothetical protein